MRVLLLAALLVVVACRNEGTGASDKPPGELVTRFDELTADAPASPTAVRRAVNATQRAVAKHLDTALISAVAQTLQGDPQTVDDARTLGTLVGIVERDGEDTVLRLRDGSGPVLARFEVPKVETQPCWSTLWQPEWVPVPSVGKGMAHHGEADVVWWRFDDGDKPPILLRFDTEGIALLRPGEDCYRSESLLGLVGGAMRVVDFSSPTALTDGVTPSISEETSGTKPLRFAVPGMRGEQFIVVREGLVEFRRATNQPIHRWKNTSSKHSAACSRAAVHVFDGERRYVFVEVEFSDDEACDESWERREVQQTLFEVVSGQFVPVLSFGMSTQGEEDGGSKVEQTLDVRIPSGDGVLRYVGKGLTRNSDSGGEAHYECKSDGLAGGMRLVTGIAEEIHSGAWTFEASATATAIGSVRVVARTLQCNELL